MAALVQKLTLVCNLSQLPLWITSSAVLARNFASGVGGTRPELNSGQTIADFTGQSGNSPISALGRCCQSNSKLSPLWGRIGPKLGGCPCKQSRSNGTG